MIPALGLRALFVLGAVAFLVGVGWYARGVVAERDEAATVARMAAERAALLADAGKEADRRMAETERRLAAQKESTNEALRQAQRERDARATADLVARSLHERAAALAAASDARKCDPSADGRGAPAVASAGVFADLFRRADEAAGRMAEVAGQRYVAGLACEREHDALMGAKQ